MLARFDPFQAVDSLFSPLWSRQQLAMDTYRRGDQFFVELDLAGVNPETIDVTVENNVLTVSARRDAGYREGDQVLLTERAHGDVVRQLYLGKGLDTDRIDANYVNGVLFLTIPVADEAKPHKIQIRSGGSEAIEANAAQRAAVNA